MVESSKAEDTDGTSPPASPAIQAPSSPPASQAAASAPGPLALGWTWTFVWLVGIGAGVASAFAEQHRGTPHAVGSAVGAIAITVVLAWIAARAVWQFSNGKPGPSRVTFCFAALTVFMGATGRFGEALRNGGDSGGVERVQERVAAEMTREIVALSADYSTSVDAFLATGGVDPVGLLSAEDRVSRLKAARELAGKARGVLAFVKNATSEMTTRLQASGVSGEAASTFIRSFTAGAARGGKLEIMELEVRIVNAMVTLLEILNEAEWTLEAGTVAFDKDEDVERWNAAHTSLTQDGERQEALMAKAAKAP